VVERRDTREITGAREVAHGVLHDATIREGRQRENLVDAIAHPWLAEERLEREEHHVAPFALALLEELVALEVAGEAEDRPPLRRLACLYVRRGVQSGRRVLQSMAEHILYKLGPFDIPKVGSRHVRVYVPPNGLGAAPPAGPRPVLY